MENKAKERMIYPRNLDEAQEFYRKRLIQADSQIEMVMTRFYSSYNNRYKPMMLERSTIDKIVERYGANGYVYVAAWNPDANSHTNDAATRKLLNDIRKSSYKYLPIFVGYKEWERKWIDYFGMSFIVFNSDKNYKSQDWQKFSEFGAELRNRYNYITMFEKADELYQEIFSRYNEDIISFIDSTDQKCYVNPSPCDRNEEIMRHSSGEIIVMRQVFDEWIKG